MDQIKDRPYSDRALIKLLIPLIIERLLAVTVGLADSLMVASVGEAAVSAVSLVDSVNVLFIDLCSSLATGGAIITGQYLGHRAMEKAQRSAEQLLIFMGAVSLVLTALLYLFKAAIIQVLFGAVEPDVAAGLDVYYNIVEISIPFLSLYAGGAALFRVMGDSKTAMVISLLMNLINVAGNAVLIFGVKMGVAGVAIPTLASRIFAAAAVIWLLRNQKLEIHLPKKFRLFFDRQTVGQIVRTGVPIGIEGSMVQLGKIMLLSAVSTLGTASITANAIGNTMISFQNLTGSATGTAITTVISYCVGQGDYEAVNYYRKKLMRFADLTMAVVNVVILALIPAILDVYQVSEETRYLATQILWLHGSMSIFFWNLAWAFPQVLRAAGDTRYTMLVSSSSMLLCRVTLGILLCTKLGVGVLGVWIAMCVDWFVRITFFLLRYRSGKWKNMAIKQ